MWTVVYMTQSKESAEKLQRLLEEQSILVMVRTLGKEAEEEECGYEVLVPESEMEQTHNIIIDNEL